MRIPSTIKLFSAILSAAIVFPLAAVSPEYDETLYAALQREGMARAMLLADAIEAKPENPTSALYLLKTVNLSANELKQFAVRYEEIWKKHPANAAIALHGSVIQEDVIKAKLAQARGKSAYQLSVFFGICAGMVQILCCGSLVSGGHSVNAVVNGHL